MFTVSDRQTDRQTGRRTATKQFDTQHGKTLVHDIRVQWSARLLAVMYAVILTAAACLERTKLQKGIQRTFVRSKQAAAVKITSGR